MSLFRHKLEEATTGKKNQICLGIDPHLAHLPPFMREFLALHGTADGICRWVLQLLEISAPHLPAVKFQSAFFEAMGWQGWRCLEEVTKASRRLGMVTIVDGKRGDISSTMHAYGISAYDQLQADAMTVQAYMGPEVITSLRPWLREDRGVYLVWLSSNPNNGWMQEHGASQGKSLAADLLPQLQGILQKEGLRDSCGLVLGATRLKDLSAELLQQAQEFPLLIPGFGEQQGSCSPEVTQQLLSRGSPHLVPLSRSLTGIGSRQWQETLAELSLKEYFSWYESHLSAVVKAPQYGALSCG